MTVEVSNEGKTLERLAQARTPAEMVAVLAAESSPDTLAACFGASSSDVIRALWQRLLIVGRAHEVAGHGDGVAKQLADQFGVSKRTIERLVRAYREIAVPKLERDGQNAELLLEDRHWYDVCCELSPVVQQPAIELIEKAEAAFAENPRLSASQWKRDQLEGGGDEGSTTSEGGKLWRLLKKLSQWDDSAIADAVEGADPLKVLNDARDALVAARSVVDALEERTKGRVDQ